MSRIAADELTRTYDCKTPGCEGEATSRVGRYSYCPPCREVRAATPKQETPAAKGSYEAGAKKLVAVGRTVDQKRALAAKQTATALAAKREADAAIEEFRRQVRELLGEAA